MKAVRVHQFGGPEVLQLDTNVPIPSPGNKEVLIRVKVVGVNPVETYMRAGKYARKPDQFPFILGGDCAGTVEEVGSDVTEFKKGDRVFTMRTTSGCYAEFAVAATTSVWPLSSALSFAQGAALGVPYFTAFRALFQRGGRARAGETVLVHGASGGVGIATVQFARAYGLHVIGTAGTQQGEKMVVDGGAHHVFNHRAPGYLERVAAAAKENGDGIDVVVENASHVNLGSDLTLLAQGGRVVVVGSRGPIEINPRDTMLRETSIVGVLLWLASTSDLKEAGAAIEAGAETGWLRPMVGKEYPLEQAAAAHTEIIEGGGALGKLVLNVA